MALSKASPERTPTFSPCWSPIDTSLRTSTSVDPVIPNGFELGDVDGIDAGGGAMGVDANGAFILLEKDAVGHVNAAIVSEDFDGGAIDEDAEAKLSVHGL